MKKDEDNHAAKGPEYWDAYDGSFKRIPGVRLIRGKRIPDGMYHLVCHVLVQHKDGTFLLMQRDPRKHLGGMWEATAGGSALRGETPFEGAVRELYEETGILAQEMKEVDRKIVFRRRTWYITFLCETDSPKDSVRLQENETTAYRWVSLEEMLSMKDSEIVPGVEELYDFLR